MTAARAEPRSKNLSELFAPYRLEREGCVIAAVSGGSDSTALLLLTKAHLGDSPATTRLVAVTVDHGLRVDSADEARQVAALCAARGIQHRTLHWAGGKPKRGLPEAAREARYRLLAEAAAEDGARIVLIGHTLDDQIETVAMRAQRGAGRGLAGISPATLYAGKIWIVRPLLGCRRSELRDFLRHSDAVWIDDPSNLDKGYERVRVRAGLGSGPQGEAERLTRIAAETAAARLQAGAAAAALIRNHARRLSPGLVFVGDGLAGAPDRQAALYAMRLLLAAIGGREQLPDALRVAALLERIERPGRATLARVAVDIRREGLYLRRELRDLPQTDAMDEAIWDERFTIEGGADAVIGAVGRTHAAEIVDAAEGIPKGLAVAALAAEPALWREGVFLGPLFGDAGTTTARRRITPFARFLPCFDLSAAAALAALLDAPLVPAPPWESHIEAHA